MEDPIQNLLSSMGWSCDDLLEKLQQYKNLTKVNENPKDSNHSSQSNAAEGSSNSCDGGEISTSDTSDAKRSDTVEEGGVKEDAPLDSDSETKHIVDDSVSKTVTPDSANTKVPACTQNGVKTVAEHLETEINDSSDKCNAESAIVDKESDKTKSGDVSLEANVAAASTRNEESEIISLTDDDDSATYWGSENESNIKEVAETDQNANDEEVEIICEIEGDDTANKDENSLVENKSDFKDAKNEEAAIISLLEDDDMTSCGSENENSEEKDEKGIKEMAETERNTKNEDAIISLMEDDDMATFKNKNEDSQAKNENDQKEAETDQNTKDKEITSVSSLEDDDTGTIENKNENCETKNENDVKEVADTEKNTKDGEDAIISLMEGDGMATSGSNNEGHQEKNESFVEEAAVVAKTDKNTKDEEGAIVSLMEDTATSENKNDDSEAKVKEAQQVTENDAISSIGDAAAATKNQSEVEEASNVTEMAEESNDSVFLKPTATVKEYNEAKKSETSQEEEDCEPEPEPQQNEEEVRNMLRMQILQLRNKKKVDVIPSPLDKELLTREIPESKKKKRKLSTDDEKEELSPPKKVVVEEESNRKDDLDNAVLSNESEFLIVNIIGGYKSPEPAEAEEPSNSKEPSNSEEPSKAEEPSGAEEANIETPTTQIINEHLEGEPLHLTKTNNYKDIKGWQRKKFIVPIEDATPPKKAPFFDEAVPSCSFDLPSVAPPQENPETVKSAFESNLLDEFLVEHSQLNISYEVPKLHAEESITHDELLVPVKSFDVNFDKLAESMDDKKPLERYKPKTLAEKRKMLQKIERKKEKERDEVKTEAEESSGFYVSRLYCRGKVIKVRTRVPYSGFVYYMTRNGFSKHASSRKSAKRPFYVTEAQRELEKTGKPSLLTCLRTPDVEKVCYKPGPLSRKRKLQDEDSANSWTTVIKKLPKITLEVFPEFCKPLDPRVLCYVQFDGEVLTEKRVDFALAALKGEEKPKGFVFPVQYKNDEKYMLLRKQRSQSPVKVATPPPEEDDQKAVQIVIDKLLSYVEISEIADDLLKPDPEERIAEKPDIVKPLPPINNRIDAIIKSSRKRRTSLELRRLNVKIIDVDVAEKEDTEACLKPYCKMGCVCKSLECGKSYNFHCGNRECMLDCKCNFSRLKHTDEKVILPAGTDILSVGTVSHLQKQAKRNLAKVEKEFVQTVIQSNDKTIILGTGTRDRQRRATKLPRKMSDYVALHKIDEEGMKVEEVEKKPSKKPQKPDLKKCAVKVEKLDLSDLIPLCLVHGLYDCHCGFKAPYPATDPIPQPQSEGSTPQSSPEPSSDLEKPEPTRQKQYQRRPRLREITPDERHSPDFTADNPDPTRKRQPSPEHCARTRQVLTEKYRVRNAAIGYLDHLRKVLARKEKLYSTPGSPKKLSPSPSPPALKTHRRKQTLELRDDDSSSAHSVEVTSVPAEKAMQRRKKRVSIGSNGSMEAVPTDNLWDDIQEEQPRQLMEELGRYLGKESRDKVHLLPWEILVSGYKDGRLQVWCNLRAKKMLITKTRIRPNRTYMNVNFLQHCVCNKEEIDIDIIRCLMTNKVPKDKNPKEVLLVLTFNDSNSRTAYFEVRGICEKSNYSSKSSLSLIKSDLNHDVPTSAETFVHKTMDNELKLIPLVRKVFCERNLMYHRKSPVVQNPQAIIQVPLPDIEANQRWCMVSITRKYSYLLFCDINYSIKRVDFSDLAELSRSWQQTLILDAKHLNQNNPEFKKNIYVVPTHKDRVFIGPYLKKEDAKIETLDYVDGVLVNTDLYCKMKGELASSCTWLTQVYNDDSAETATEVSQRSLLQSSSMPPDLVVIDDDDDDDEEEEQQAAAEQSAEGAAAQSIVAQPTAADDDDDVVLVKDKEYIKESDLMRYFVPNVKGLGYIVGTQLPQSKIIDVRWPFTNNIQRFSKAEDAIISIERQLGLMLIPRPAGFKLRVTVVDQVDSDMVPFQVEYGQGHYAIGEYGICNLLKTKPSDYPFPGGLSDDLIDILMQRSSKFVLHNCLKLTEIFTPSVHSTRYNTIPEMLDGAKTEIKHQEETLDKLNKAKIALELKRLELFQKLKALKESEQKNQQTENEKSPPETQIRTTATKEEVLIEISDDEDDKNQAEAPSLKNIQIEKPAKLLPPATKLVPPLLKITKTTTAKEGNKLILSALKPSNPVFKTQRSLIKVPITGLLKKNTIPGAQKFVLVRDRTDPEIIKRLKMNSGLQVSVSDTNKDNTESSSSPVMPTPVSLANKETTPANPMQVQTCEIVTVKENNGVKCVSLKRRIPVTELQFLVKKQLSTKNSNNETK